MDWKKHTPSILKEFLSRVKRYRGFLELANAGEIARRYFVMNAFDGALTVLGIILGAYIGGVRNVNVILSAVLGASLAMGLSGLWGAYMAEKAERLRKLKELEAALFTDLKQTRIYRASLATMVWLAIVDGISPVVVALASVSPFLFTRAGLCPFISAVYISIGITITVLFTLGIFLGKISRENMVLNGLRMVSAGIIIAAILLLAEAIL
ncbi:MAG: VIT1/CCC1 transporter family protein [Candidatus Hecatellaceae archaeon]